MLSDFRRLPAGIYPEIPISVQEIFEFAPQLAEAFIFFTSIFNMQIYMLPVPLE